MIGTSVFSRHGDLSASSNVGSIDSARSESSWTPYLVDFLTHDSNREDNTIFSCSSDDEEGDITKKSTTKRTSNFKKRRTQEVPPVVDEALEDTASSPNTISPSKDDRDFTGLPDIDRKKIEHELLMAEGNVLERITDEKNDCLVGNSEEKYRDRSSELKKKGLCLVPVSLVVTYCNGRLG